MARAAAAAAAGGAGGLWRAAFLGCCCCCLFSRCLCRDVPTRDASPSCYTDFATELACCWEGDPSANCTEAFQLRYKAGRARSSQACPLEDRRGPASASWCTCVVPTKAFRHVQYHLELYRKTAGGRTVVWQESREAENMVKPRPLVNLTVAKKSHSFLLAWKKDYAASNHIYHAKAKYEVAYWPQSLGEKLPRCSGSGHACCAHRCWAPDTEPPCFAKKQEVLELSSKYEIYADQLTPHSDYMASVRYRLELWETVWSEWSSPCTWHNDLELGDSGWKNIPWVCLPVVAAILSCYLCIGRVRKWQDSIPHPVVTMGEQVPGSSFPEKEAKRSAFGVQALLCGLCRRPGREPPVGRPPAPASGLTTPEEVPRKQARAQREQVLWPETPLVEPAPVVCGCAAGTGAAAQQEEVQERPHIPHAPAVAALFSNAVSDGLHSGHSAGLGAPRLLPPVPLGAHSGQGGGPAAEAPPEPGPLSPSWAAAAPAAAGPARPEGPGCGRPSPSEEPPRPTLLGPPGPPGGPAFLLESSGPCPGEQAGGPRPPPGGYRPFGSLSKPMALFFREACEDQPPRPAGNQPQLPGGGSGNHHEPHVLPQRPRACAPQEPQLPGGRDSLWLFPGEAPAAHPLAAPPPQGDSCPGAPGAPSPTFGPGALLSPGYRSLASLLPTGTEGMYPGSPGPETPYKPLPAVLRSGSAEEPPRGGALGLGGKATGMSAWPGVLWDAPLALSQELDSAGGDFAGDGGLSWLWATGGEKDG